MGAQPALRSPPTPALGGSPTPPRFIEILFLWTSSEAWKPRELCARLPLPYAVPRLHPYGGGDAAQVSRPLARPKERLPRAIRAIPPLCFHSFSCLSFFSSSFVFVPRSPPLSLSLSSYRRPFPSVCRLLPAGLFSSRSALFPVRVSPRTTPLAATIDSNFARHPPLSLYSLLRSFNSIARFLFFFYSFFFFFERASSRKTRELGEIEFTVLFFYTFESVESLRQG